MRKPGIRMVMRHTRLRSARYRQAPRALVIGGVALLTGSAALAQVCEPHWQGFDPSTSSFPGANLHIRAMMRWDVDVGGPAPEVVVVGGQFTIVSDIVASRIAIWDPATGAWSNLGAGLDGQVLCLAAPPDVGLIVGGEFLAAGGAPASFSRHHNTLTP